MIIFALATGGFNTNVAFLERKGKLVNILASHCWQSENNEAEKLLPAIEKLLKKNKKDFAVIKEIYVLKGPGSFTGLRVGVTVANTLAYLNSAKLYAISTFEYWHEITNLPVLIFAGKGGVYLSENPKKEAELINLDELNKILKKKKIKKVTGSISEEQKKILITAKFQEILTLDFAEIMTQIVQQKKLKPVKIVKPLYIKPPGVTQSKK